jgi:hypothetical protein
LLREKAQVQPVVMANSITTARPFRVVIRFAGRSTAGISSVAEGNCHKHPRSISFWGDLRGRRNPSCRANVTKDTRLTGVGWDKEHYGGGQHDRTDREYVPEYIVRGSRAAARSLAPDFRYPYAAVCIGANTTIFSIANSIPVRPLPYPGSERSDWISERSGPGNEDVGAAPAYYRLRDGNRVFEDVAAFNPVTVNWTSTERPEQMNAAVVSAPFFRSPATGRIRQRITELGNAGAEGE